MLLKFLRKFNTKLTKTAYHEIGHLLLVMLFDTDFEMNLITANKKTANSKMSNTNGGAGFTIKADSYSLDIHDKICIIGIAGICSQNLFFADTKGKSHDSIIPLYIKFPGSEMNNEGGKEDFRIVKTQLTEISKLKKINQKDHLTEIMDFCFDYLSNETIWEIAKQLVEELKGKKNLTLEYHEITGFLEEQNLLADMKIINSGFIKKRYPVIKTKYNKTYS